LAVLILDHPNFVAFLFRANGKTMCFRSDKDNAGRQFDPTEIAAATAIQTPGDATELGEKGVSTLDSAADTSHPWLPRGCA
jgi:hypothetical protein